MTMYIKTTTINNHQIAIYQEKFETCFYVEDYDLKYQCSDSKLIYPTMEKAKARYNYLVRKHKKEA